MEGAAQRTGTEKREYERLRASKKRRTGNEEVATVRDVFVGEERVVLTLGFEWTTDTERLAYDLADDRDVLKLEALAESQGFEFEHVSFLEGERLPVVATEGGWVPSAHRGYAPDEGSVRETFVTECRLLARELAQTPGVFRRLVRIGRTMTTRQLIIAVIVVKKLLIVALVAWLVL
ncbi:hypothetical protein [Halorussus marinus]|uniref:hypothetical protein n=1 Tax=Halorussus marinus TaxID=2505976 RepID=UPI00106EE166|nr:hypothetical protein [Halorussus marinus]